MFAYLLTELGANPESPAGQKNLPREKNLAGFRWKPCLRGCLQRTLPLQRETPVTRAHFAPPLPRTTS